MILCCSIQEESGNLLITEETSYKTYRSYYVNVQMESMLPAGHQHAFNVALLICSQAWDAGISLSPNL